MSGQLVALSIVLFAAIVLANLVLTLAIIRRINNPTMTPGMANVETLKQGARVPHFTAALLGGGEVSEGDFADKPTVFVFSSPTCPPCREGMPTYSKLAELAPAARANFALVMDGDPDASEAMVSEFGLKCPVVLANRSGNSMFSDWRVPGTPSFVLFDRGEVRSAGLCLETLHVWQQVIGWFEEGASLATKAAIS